MTWGCVKPVTQANSEQQIAQSFRVLTAIDTRALFLNNTLAVEGACMCFLRDAGARLQDARWEFMRANNKIRFIRAVITGELLVSNRKRADIEADLEAQGFDRMAKSKDVSRAPRVFTPRVIASVLLASRLPRGRWSAQF